METSVSHLCIELVQTILQEHFGARCAQVAQCLLRRGPSPIFEIRATTHLSFYEIRNSLLTLIQHNVVTFADGTPVRYTIDATEALLRIRFARFSVFVGQHRGVAARLLFTEVLKHGRVTLQDAIRYTLDSFEKSGDKVSELLQAQKAVVRKDTMPAATNDSNDDEEEDHEHDSTSSYARNVVKLSSSFKEPTLKSQFIHLVADNFLIRVDAAREDLSSEHQSQSESNEGAAKIDSNVVEAPLTAETTNALAVQLSKPRTGKAVQRAQKQATSMTRKRKRGVATDSVSLGVDSHGKEGTSSDLDLLTFLDVTSYTNNESEEHKRSFVGGGAKADVQGLLETMERTRAVFRVNTRYMNFTLLREMAENFVTTRWAESRIVRYLTRILLQSARLQQQTNSIVTQGQTFHDIRHKLVKLSSELPNFKVPDSTVLLQLLDALGRTDKIIRNVTQGGIAMFIFDWDRFKSVVHERLLFNAIVARSGLKAGRVWSLLSQPVSDYAGSRQELGFDCDGNKLWEDQQVADQALLPPHLARQLLYSLCSAGFIRMHQSDIVTGAPPSCASKHSLIYSACTSLAKHQVLQDCYNIMLNLLKRKQCEAAHIARLMFSVTGLSSKEDHQLRQHEAGEDRLECAFLHLDATAILQLRDM